jgi:RNA polymerase-interacting CarD/CdnL/TRCF family regulator
MGRVGRNNIQQDYTIRFRDDAMIKNLFKVPEHNMEAINIRKLFVSGNI